MVVLIKSVDEFEITKKMNYVLKQYEIGNIKSSLGGYFIEAIKNNWNVEDKRKLKEKLLKDYEKEEIIKRISELESNEYAILESIAKERLAGKEGLVTYNAILYNIVVCVYKELYSCVANDVKK